jgi:predicted GIY-YIG superfamily endonuclease
MYYVYILIDKNSHPYTGCTNDLRDRIKRHNEGYVPATKNLRPMKLHCYFAFLNKYTAFNFEKYLKSGSGRAFIKKHQFCNIDL